MVTRSHRSCCALLGEVKLGVVADGRALHYRYAVVAGV